MTGNRESVIGSVVGGTAAGPLSYVGSKRSHSLAVSRNPAAGETFDGGVIHSYFEFIVQLCSVTSKLKYRMVISYPVYHNMDIYEIQP